MKIGSLFSGIGGLERGLEAALDGHTIWQVEQAEYPRRVLAKHWPNARRYDDIRRVNAHELAPVDLVCGGFPCQDISTAGKGAGLEGAKSGLWWEYVRVLRVARPRLVVVENVAALITRGLDEVLGALAGLGYDAEWSVLSAADVGAPHLRRRLFIIAWIPDTVGDTVQQQGGERSPPSHRCKRFEAPPEPRRHGDAQPLADCNCGRCEEQRLAQPDREQGTRRHLVDGRGEVRQLDDAETLAIPDTDGVDEDDRRHGSAAPIGCEREEDTRDAQGWVSQPGLGGVPNGIPPWLYRGLDPEAWEQGQPRTVPPRTVDSRPARLRALGNAVTPQQAYEVGLRVRSLLAAGKVGLA